MVENLIYIVAAYLIGSVPFGYLAGRMNGLDLREHGSRNIGATNAVRVLGKKWGIPVFVCDFLKGYLPLLFMAQHLGGDVTTFDAAQMGWFLGVLFALVCRTLMIGLRSQDRLGTYICTGVFAAMAWQMFINLGMNLGVLPVIGVTLPFFSGGGTSMLMLYLCVGIVLSVHIHNKKNIFE